jgi:uncharacterized repeat protein (TIGR01451 family)
VQVAYYSVELSGTITTCPTNLVTNNTYEALVQAQFGVAASVGTITVEKFDDLNGSGVFAANDPLVPNFNFSVTAPNPDFVGTTNYAEVTDVGGTFVLTGVPAGPNATYTISEVLPDPNPLAWTPSTGTGSQTFTLTTNGQNQTLLFGNVQLTSLCGTVYEDTGHVGKFASGQPGVPGVVLTLGGASGAGVAVPAGKTETSDANGNYCFNGLYPGTYSVSEGTPPATLSTETDIDGIANGANYIDPIAVTSGTPSEGNNFLLVPPVPLPPVVTPKPKPTPKPTPKPKPKPVLTKLCISKHVNLAQVKQGQAVTWTVTVKDCGKNTAKRVTTTDPLLAGITLNNTDGAKLVLGQLVWDTGTLKRGQSRTYRFVTRFSTNAALGIHVNHANAVAANAKRVNAQAQTRVVALPRPPIAVPITG